MTERCSSHTSTRRMSKSSLSQGGAVADAHSERGAARERVSTRVRGAGGARPGGGTGCWTAGNADTNERKINMKVACQACVVVRFSAVTASELAVHARGADRV